MECSTPLAPKGLIALFAFLVFTAEAAAVQPGKTLEWKSPMGRVIFDGKVHADRGLTCDDCHKRIFQQKKGPSDFKMADIKMRRFCGECHNGSKAFNANDGANCSRCHIK